MVYYTPEVDEILYHRGKCMSMSRPFPDNMRETAELAYACLDQLIDPATDEMASTLREMIDRGDWDED